MQSVANDNVSRSFSYDSYSRVNGVTVAIDSLTRSSSFSFDDYHRPTAVTYHGGEVVTTKYGSPGAAVGLRSSIHGDLVDNVKYDEAGRMTAMRFPAGGNLWRTQSYYPWTARRNGGMLASLKVGFDEGGGERLSRGYAYNSFGDLSALTEGTDSYAFTYDGLGRLTSAYDRSYSYDGASRLSAFNGQAYGYGDSGPYHAVDRIAGADRFDYDANGNMTKRNKGLSDQQTLVWNDENRLSQVQDDQGNLVERYWYGVEGMRVKKTRGNTTTYTFFAQYEEEVTNGVTTVVSYYTFGSMRVAVKRGNTLYHLHGDHLSSTSLTTRGSSTTASRAYYAYGAERSATGDLRTDRTFTGQKRDATGLMYYNARYYDPALGTFISPDSLVPGAGQVINYNRFLYARGNPLRFTDPSGHIAQHAGGPEADADKWERDFYWNNRFYRAQGFAFNPATGHWTDHVTPQYSDLDILEDTLSQAGIRVDWSSWSKGDDKEMTYLSLLAEGVAELAKTIGSNGFKRLKQMTGGNVTWHRYQVGYGLCSLGPACTVGRTVSFYDKLFEYSGSLQDQTAINRHATHIRATAVHEVAHVIHNMSCATVYGMGQFCTLQFGVLVGVGYGISGYGSHDITIYAETNPWEYWAEAVTDWVYKDQYMPSEPAPSGEIYRTTDNQRNYIKGLFKGP